jgi:cyclic beta-1,2-glucan synthetase
VINRLISESARPEPSARGLPFTAGIAARAHGRWSCIPAMLTDPSRGAALAHQLQLHYLANPERGVQFALLTDWADAPARALSPTDCGAARAAVHAAERLERALLRSATDEPPRFIVLHPRAQLLQIEAALDRLGAQARQARAVARDARPTARRRPSLDLGRVSQVAPGVRYVLTLDSDTRLPPGRAARAVGVAAHPHNRPRLSADGGRVDRGYGILQPHVATPLARTRGVTLYHWLFAGQSGIDPYSVASSEVYQDVFGEGTFTGKGLLDVARVHAVLGGAPARGQVLSHDLLEGSLARCAAVTDSRVMEDAPFHADVAASRVHRWTRGDWQLLPILLRPGRVSAARRSTRWKMLDNLRRSLVAPASLALTRRRLGDAGRAPWTVLA